MSKKAYKIVNLIIAVLIFVFGVGNAFAWLADDRKEDSLGIDGSSGDTYFAGGSGSATDPYLINDKYHMYNLAWLQNTGKFVDKDGNPEKYYFELSSNVDMGDLWLPPIGTDTQPFIGEFDGNGYTISNLKVTTDKSKLKSAPDITNGFSNAVGMFGMTNKKAGETNGAVIHNFILKEPIVEVATQNATYATSALQNKDMAAGLAIGYLNTGCKAYSIGVLAPETKTDGTTVNGAQLLMQRENCGYSTFNSIIGALGPDVSSSVTGGGHVVSSGGDTSIFNPSQFFGTNGNFNFTPEQTSNFMDASGLKASTWLVSVKGKTNDNSSAHLGIGNFAFINEKTTSFSTSSAASITDNTKVIYKSVTYNASNKNGNVTDHGTVTLGSGSDSEYAKNFVDTSGNQISSFSNCLYMENSPTYSSGTTSNIKVVDESNTVLANAAAYSIPLNVILVNIVDTTKARLLVVAGGHKNSRSIAIKRLVEQDGKKGLKDFNFYTGYSRFSTSANDLSVGYSTGDIKDYPGFSLLLQGKELTAYEVDLRNRGEGIYALYSTNGGIDIFYLAVVGVEGGNAGSATGEIEAGVDVSAIDFIYDAGEGNGVKIAQPEDVTQGVSFKVGDFIVNTSGTNQLYEATGTSVYFDKLNVVLQIVYIRKTVTESTTDPTMQVTTSDTSKVTATDTTKVTFSAAS